jgi:hypothetical protein
MKKMAFIAILLLTITAVTAQSISIVSTYNPIKEKGFHAQFNTTGDQLAFTTESYVGLSVYNFSENATIKITEKAGAGFQPVFSNDNKKVFYKNTVYKARLRMDGVKSYDFASKTALEMLAPRRNMKQPQTIQNGIMVFADTKIFKSTLNRKKTPVTNYIWSDGSNLNIYRDNKLQLLNPVKGANGYIWASLSPNEKMILFTAAGAGTFVCDLNGKIIAKLGYLNAPTWYDDNFVVGMQDKDDGHFVTGSKILMKSLDGKIEKVLSAANQIAMYPTAAASANRVAFNTLNGEIYVLELKIYR